MSIKTGRLGWLGIALETTAGAPLAPVAYVPFLEDSLMEKQGVLADVSARGTRDQNPENSQLGKRWGEGSIKVNMDATVAPYFFAMAMGSRTPVSQGSGVYLHTFTRLNSNTPQTATLTFDRVTDRQAFPYSVMNSMEVNFDEAFAEVSANILSRFPSPSVSGTLTTTSGMYYAFRHAQISVGNTVATANTTLKLKAFKLTVNNNAETYYVAGNRDADAIIQKNFAVSGSFTVAFESTTQRDNFNNLSKQAIVVNFVGNGIGGGLNEQINFRLYKVRIDELKTNVPIDSYISQEISFTGEYSSADGSTMDIQVQNTVASY
jgi:hypothetical protein